MGSYFKCPRCGNEDLAKVGYLNGKPYCRACINFIDSNVPYEGGEKKEVNIHLEYSLSKEQTELSDALIKNYLAGKSTLVKACCGSGKTEISLNLIAYVLSNGGTVGFAIPRRDVVIEIYDRLKDIFRDNSLVAVYGGHTKNLKADIICLTSHQLFRYDHYFDLLILDEIDAFPFKGDEVLNALFFRSIRGGFVQMSATPSDKVIEFFSRPGYEILNLNKRYHGVPLPVPEVIESRFFFKYFHLIQYVKRFEREGKPLFLFAPTIEMCENLFSFLKYIIKKVNIVHSKKIDRSEIISSFKQGEIQTLVTTAVLERGVTVKNLQVIVFHADHPLYDKSTLIQIAGRVGRKKDAPYGEVIFICDKENEEIRKCIQDINSSNESL